MMLRLWKTVKFELNLSITTEIKICPSYCFTWHNTSPMNRISFVFNFAGRTLVVKVPLHKMVSFSELRGNWKLSLHWQVNSQSCIQPWIQDQRQSFCLFIIWSRAHPQVSAGALLQAGMGWMAQHRVDAVSSAQTPPAAAAPGCLLAWLHSNFKGAILLFLPSFVQFFSLLREEDAPYLKHFILIALE